MPPRSTTDPPIIPAVDHHLAAQQLAEAGIVELRTFGQGRAYTISHPSHVVYALKNFLAAEQGQKPDWFEWKAWDTIIFGFWPPSGKPEAT